MIEFRAYVIKDCPFCDELGKFYNMKLAKEYPDVIFETTCLSEELAEDWGLKTFPTIECFSTLLNESLGMIEGPIYEGQLREFINVIVDKFGGLEEIN